MGDDAKALVEYIDVDQSGSVTFLEFVAALGLAVRPEVEESADPEDESS